MLWLPLTSADVEGLIQGRGLSPSAEASSWGGTDRPRGEHWAKDSLGYKFINIIVNSDQFMENTVMKQKTKKQIGSDNW